MFRNRNLNRLLAGSASLGLAGFASLGMTACNPNPETVQFSATGAPQTYVVPDNVCAVSVVAMGAQGGAGSISTWTSTAGGGHLFMVFPVAGGMGAGASSTIAVTPGEPLQVNVGGKGDGVGVVDDDGMYTTPDAGKGGWNGGADGGVDTNPSAKAGGGGGASDVRRGGTGLANRIVVAGGGGGTGAGSGVSTPNPAGGVGGNPATDGGPGSNLAIDPNGGTPTSVATGAGGGGAASTTAGGPGGSGGVDGSAVGAVGAAGMLGVGGLGAGSTVSDGGNSDLGGFTGGGGGGGLYGGGGGGAAGYTAASGASRVTGAGGGGGSSLGDTVVAGLHEGDGLVTITPVDGSCGGGSSSTIPSSTTTAAADKPAGS